jgi:hypothetical protein
MGLQALDASNPVQPAGLGNFQPMGAAAAADLWFYHSGK